ncbi:MAG: glycosyltransferase family 4 protein [Candidatus Krumholzibacteriia bacterium]
MQILFATNMRRWGGGEKWMLTAAAAMRERGHGVALAAPPDAVILARADRAGIEVLPAPFARDLDPVSFLRVWRHCRRRRVQVLCLNMDRVLRIAGLAARLAGVPVVLPRRGSEFPLKSHLNYRFHYRCVATGVIVNSEATARTLVQDIAWRPAGSVHVLYNGLDLAPFATARPRARLRRALGLAEGDLALVLVGELTARKNAALLVGVLPSLLRDHPRVQVLLAGEGEEREALSGQAAGLGVADHVRILGFRDDVPDLLAAADLLVHPARVEGFGYAVVEAMAAGLPVVATRASSIPEIVVDGETGFLFPLDDAAGLEAAVRRYLADPDLRARHGAAGREHVRRRFELGARTGELEAIFRTQLEQRTGR